MLNANDVRHLLANATTDTILHLDYVAGGKPGQTASDDLEKASDWKKAPTSYTGHFVSLRTNKWGEIVLTVFCHNRGEIGKCRSFNPSVGTLRNLEVVS